MKYLYLVIQGGFFEAYPPFRNSTFVNIRVKWGKYEDSEIAVFRFFFRQVRLSHANTVALSYNERITS